MLVKRIGKIESIRIGYGGYQNAYFGITFTLASNNWTIELFNGRNVNLVDMLMDILDDAKLKDIKDLIGLPVEVEFDDDKIKAWRLLKEAL